MKHANKKFHNWLVYYNLEKQLTRHKDKYQGTVYDLGCGEKPYQHFFLQHASGYVGVDWSNTPHLLKADVVADLNKPLPIADGVAGTIVSISVLEHLAEPNIMLSEANRILTTGGYVFLQVPWQWWIHEAPYDYFRYSPYGLKYLFEKNGFDNVHVEASAGFFSTMALKFNYFTLRAINITKPIRALLKVLLIPFWMVGQVLAIVLDNLDRNWMLEAPSYVVTARKRTS